MHYENYVNDILLEKGINSIDKLNITDLADAFGINVYYFNCGTHLISEEELYCIIDSSKNEVIQYEEFLHELAHYIYMHDYRYLTDFNRWKHIELKVNSLVPYLAIPKFALGELLYTATVNEAANRFNISTHLAWKRVNLIKNMKLKRLGF
jgi:hypothetical protein